MSIARKEALMKKVNAKKAIEKIAEREGISPQDVRREIEKALLIGWCNSDPAIRENWRHIPCKGDMPTPEELIIYLAKNVKARLY